MNQDIRRYGYLILSLGIVVVLTFVLTGHYMDGKYDHLRGMGDFDRMAFRMRHILILISGLALGLNGIYFEFFENFIARIFQIIGIVLITISCGLFIYSFFFELPTDVIELPTRRRAIYVIFGGAIFQLIGFIVNAILKRPQKTV